ncbi:S-layer homology domain-containing protein [Paenibacillus koleovorans]|uniref:S-layer homology domain-containing protein n=1 Tax=Paenibacillus koleovorans TaxID=121608 RepID=UPI000FDC2D6F|nr:S-layer homology domain-containing protein [Paenibacillus koleovorans]
MRKRWISAILVLLLLLSVQANAFAFSDIKGDAAEADIIALRDAGIVSGMSAEQFAPKGKVTYAQAVHLIVKGFGLNIDHIRFIKQPLASDFYSNVPNDSWYAESFIIANLNGLSIPQDVNPNSVITREQFAQLLFEGISVKGDFPLIQIWINIQDEADVSKEYMTSIQSLLIMKVAMLEDGNFLPKQEVTRGEAAQLLHRAMQFVKKHQPIAPAPPADHEVSMNVTKVTDAVNQVTVSWGSKPNPGYTIGIDRIEFRPNGEAWIYYMTGTPDPNKMYPQVIVEPKVDTYVSSAYKPVLKPAK